MEKLKKEYRKAGLDLALEVLRKNFSDNNIVLDKEIAETVYLLMVYGFNTIMSCEGHISSTTCSTFRNFYPYVQITLNNKVVFDLEPKDKKSFFRVENENHFASLKRLEELIVDFNLTRHPFFKDNSEMGIVFSNDVFNPLRFREVMEKHWNVNVMLCDIGVHGILGMPQEFLNDSFRATFLDRTRDEMKRFTQFLYWNAVENGI